MKFKYLARAGWYLSLPGFILLFGLYACTTDPGLPEQTNNGGFQWSFPEHFPLPHYNMAHNLPTEKGIALGRALFYDPILSSDSSVSCGSCHAQVHAFADHNIRVSVGVGGALGTRNAPTLSNLIWNTSFMWDGGINHIEVMPLGPISEPHEMNEDIVSILEKIKGNARYEHLFEQAFGKHNINARNMLLAMAQFMSVMISADSRYDKRLKGELNFNKDEENGYQLFIQHCSSCHQEPLTTDHSFRNNGLDSVFSDPGRMRITGREADLGLFKVPSLRNVALTYPYMHDGRFRNLEEVLEHYRNGIQDVPSTDSLLRNGISMSDEEKDHLLAFLMTLTDEKYLSNPRLSEPRTQ